MQLRQADLFMGLNPVVLKAVMAAGTRHAFTEGEYVYHRGDPADFLYILMDGDVRLRLGDEGSELFTIAALGEVFGRLFAELSPVAVLVAPDRWQG